MPELIPIPVPPQPPALEVFATNELGQVNASLARRVEEHRDRFRAFWRTYQFTPDEILVQFGTPNAVIWLQAAGESMNHINRLAQTVGKTIADFLDPSDFVPPRAFVVSDQGVVTLAPPAEGFDAWGRPLPEPPPEPEPEPEPEDEL
jgi:hypothetical protein